MLKETDFEFKKRDSKIGYCLVRMENLFNDKEKRLYYNELEELIKGL